MGKKLAADVQAKLYKSVIPIAKKARNSFIAEGKVIEDSFELVEQLGFLLLKFPAFGASEEISGFYIKKGNIDCIYINSLMSLGRQNLSVWHEYYHYYTGDGYGLSYLSNSEENESEYKANAFASCILMPEELIYEYLLSENIKLPYITNIKLIQMQSYFKVSLSALLTRLCMLFPGCSDGLKKRYWLTGNNDKSKQALYGLIEEAQGDISLVQPTNDIYIPNSYFDDIEYNIKNERISLERAKELLEMIDHLRKNV